MSLLLKTIDRSILPVKGALSRPVFSIFCLLLSGFILLTSSLVQANACIDGLSARSKFGKVQLVWTHVADTRKYDILRSLELSGPYSEMAETQSTYSTYLDTNVDNGVLYYYRIRQLSTAGQDCLSDSIAAMPPATRTRLASVPMIEGLTQALADNSLLEANLTTGNIGQIASHSTPPGHVVTQDPPVNSFVPKNYPIDYLLSTGAQIDSDKDGVFDDKDQCPGTFPGINVDNFGCPIVLPDDADNDTYEDSSDNCPTIFNPNQTDTDTDGTGDACEIVGSISITRPTASQSINTSSTSVAGTFTGPAGSSVTVNGRQACVYNNQFIINNIPLNSGDYTITAQLTPPTGIGESAQVTINRNGDSLYTIEPNSDCAVAPFDARFTLDNLDAGIQQMELDYDNDGVTDDIIVDFSNPVLVHAYTNPGAYQVNITGFDVDSNPYSQNLSIIVQDGGAIDTEIQTCWQNITTGLDTNNTAQALNELTPNAQEKFAPVFEALQDNLPAILGTFSNLQVVDINTGYAEYAINRNVDGENRIFLIYFIKDENGNWKLDSM